MGKRFNSTGVCIPYMHYMVDISDKLCKIMTLIERRDYFLINRPRQYGKTTTIFMLKEKLKHNYMVMSLNFQDIDDEIFLKEKSFSNTFVKLMAESIKIVDEEERERILNLGMDVENFRELSKVISHFIKDSSKEVVLIIDEVDKNPNNQVFLSFLGMLRNKYLLRQQGKDKTFSSVILVGINDVRNVKIKCENKDEEKHNSPWNIAVNFDVDMSFNPIEIQSMLKDYAADNKDVTIDIKNISEEIYNHTGGYPSLVSKLCSIMDRNHNKKGVTWDKEKLDKAMEKLCEYGVDYGECNRFDRTNDRKNKRSS